MPLATRMMPTPMQGHVRMVAIDAIEHDEERLYRVDCFGFTRETMIRAYGPRDAMAQVQGADAAEIATDEMIDWYRAMGGREDLLA